MISVSSSESWSRLRWIMRRSREGNRRLQSEPVDVVVSVDVDDDIRALVPLNPQMNIAVLMSKSESQSDDLNDDRLTPLVSSPMRCCSRDLPPSLSL